MRTRAGAARGAAGDGARRRREHSAAAVAARAPVGVRPCRPLDGGTREYSLGVLGGTRRCSAVLRGTLRYSVVPLYNSAVAVSALSRVDVMRRSPHLRRDGLGSPPVTSAPGLTGLTPPIAHDCRGLKRLIPAGTRGVLEGGVMGYSTGQSGYVSTGVLHRCSIGTPSSGTVSEGTQSTHGARIVLYTYIWCSWDVAPTAVAVLTAAAVVFGRKALPKVVAPDVVVVVVEYPVSTP